MANRRKLKRNINHLLGDVIEECYNSLLSNEGKNEKEVEALVDQAVDLADELIAQVNGAKKFKKRSEVKKQFSDIKEKLGEHVIGYIKKLDSL